MTTIAITKSKIQRNKNPQPKLKTLTAKIINITHQVPIECYNNYTTAIMITFLPPDSMFPTEISKIQTDPNSAPSHTQSTCLMGTLHNHKTPHHNLFFQKNSTYPKTLNFSAIVRLPHTIVNEIIIIKKKNSEHGLVVYFRV